MNIFDLILKNNMGNKYKLALSVTTGNEGTKTFSYSEMFAEADALASGLSAQGLHSGDRVALISENAPEWNIAFLAILKARCTAVLLDSSLLAGDLIQLINKSDVRCVFASPKVNNKISETVPTGLPVLDIFSHGKFFKETAQGSFSQLPTSDGDESIAAIIYSSGTTRAAAGIMHSHESLVESTMMCARSNKLTSEGKYLAVVPNSHIYGLICSVLAPMLLGADVRFIEQSTPAAIKKAFAEYRPTLFPCVPRVFELFKTEIDKKIESDPKTKKLFNLFFPICLSLRKKTGINLGKVLFKSIHLGFGGKIEIFCSAGAPMDKKTAEFYLGTGFNMLVTYGATETNIPTLGNYGRKLTADSCGRPYPDVSVKIDESGELLIKSPYMMKGYFREPELTAQAFEDGWFRTGDLCRCDQHGNYVIVGRCKENMVLASGKKVIPEEVEKAYAAITGIKEMVVCGVPASNSCCDEVHAFVVRQDLKVKKESMSLDFHRIGTQLPAHLKIVQVHYVDEIPRTSLQKPKRYLLKKIAIEEKDRLASENSRMHGTAHAVGDPDHGSIENEVIHMIAEVGQFDRSIVSADSRPFAELGIDSLQSIALAIRLEDRYGFRVDKAFNQDMTVIDMAELIRLHDENSAKYEESAKYPLRKRLGDYLLFRNVCNLARIVYKIKVSNEKVIPENSGYILCANHVSNFDFLWLTSSFNRRRFDKFCCMAKKEILNNTYVSRVISQICGMIPVDRANFRPESMKCCQSKLTEQWGLLIHPEGTRSINGELGMFKKGAAVLAINSNVPIIPAYIHGAYDVYPKGSKLPKLFNFRRMRKYAVEVAYGSPVFPLGLTADEMILQVKNSIIELKNNITGVTK